MKKAILIMLLIALSIPSFARMGKKKREKMDSWLNHTKNELVTGWGPPERVADDGAGGEILVYSSRKYYNGTTYYNYKMFYVNRSSVIYHWRTSREAVPPQQINLSVYRY
jgi:hypothetical protein